MALNIKSREAHELAASLAAETGETITAAVTEAIRERLARVKTQRRTGLAARLLAIGRDAATRLSEPFASADHGELLYDERGLPK